MKTVTVCIGNSDNKLTQFEWAKYWFEVNALIVSYAVSVYFVGHSNPCSQFQNACFVFGVEQKEYDMIKKKLTIIRQDYNQISVAVVEGESEFI